MIEILWTILNTALLLYFIYVLIGCILKGKAFFNTRFKYFSIAILIIGIVQIVLVNNSEEKKMLGTLKFFINNNIQQVKVVTIEENLCHDIRLFTKYSIEENKISNIESTSILSGFVIGFDWELTTTELKLNQNNNPTYIVNGVLFWKLFGFNIYSQGKTFYGTFE